MLNSNHTIVNEDFAVFYTNNEEFSDHHTDEKVSKNKSSASYIGSSVNERSTKWESLWLKSQILSLYNKSKKVVKSPMTHLNKDKLHRQMREEGFWKKSYHNDD
ncbi:hypothetical protein BC833DRAFT_564199 [Globomyces pollinis-pini]|nr:hypothetical protein BC833DRAFT_564199 [Globomyces pollinis-pini]